ncbi:MAG TPA: hypothetical protein VFF27_00175 [Bacteroidia bacterium]|jgi:hypothetical protein|nr:hypothetical protein [Bacteroidia bacterium]
MANILGTSGLTYGGKETMDVLIKPSFQDPKLSTIFRVMTDIQSTQKLYLLNPTSYLTQTYSSCGLPTASTGVNITQKVLTTSPLQVYTNECADVFTSTIFETWKKSGADMNDLSGTEAAKIIEKITMDAVVRDAYRIACFGNTSLSDTRYTMLNGMWKLIFDNVESYCIDRVEYLPDGTLAAGNALTYLTNLYNNCDNELAAVPEGDKHFLVTTQLYNNLIASYESAAGYTELQFRNLTNGQKLVQFRGIDVVPQRAWTTYINSDFSNSNPHRIVYTTKDNWVLGVEKESDMTTFRNWYSMDDDLYKTLLRYRMGVQFVHCGLTAVSY